MIETQNANKQEFQDLKDLIDTKVKYGDITREQAIQEYNDLTNQIQRVQIYHEYAGVLDEVATAVNNLNKKNPELNAMLDTLRRVGNDFVDTFVDAAFEARNLGLTIKKFAQEALKDLIKVQIKLALTNAFQQKTNRHADSAATSVIAVAAATQIAANAAHSAARAAAAAAVAAAAAATAGAVANAASGGAAGLLHLFPLGLPFQSGFHVSKDMLVHVHKGETIVPAGSQGDSDSGQSVYVHNEYKQYVSAYDAKSLEDEWRHGRMRQVTEQSARHGW